MLRQDGYKQNRLATVIINSVKVPALLCLAEPWNYTRSRAFKHPEGLGQNQKKKKKSFRLKTSEAVFSLTLSMSLVMQGKIL